MKIQLFAAAVVMIAAPAIAASPFDGTWKADTAASQMSDKPVVYLLTNGSYSCTTCTPPIKVPADGQFHPVTGNPYYDSLSITIVDANSIKRESKKAGKITGTSTDTVSADGKTRTYSFTDLTAANGVPVTGSIRTERVAAAPAGAHAVSGSWRNVANTDLSESGAVFTLKVEGDTLNFATKTGIAYAAKIDGPQAPVTGDPGWTGVMIKRESTNTLLETDFRDGKTVATYRMTVSADGKTLTGEVHNLLNDRKSVEVSRKQ